MSLRDRLRRGAAVAALDEARVIWMIGSPRTGTTWLLSKLRRSPPVVKTDELGISVQLGLFPDEFFGAPATGFGPERSLMDQLCADDEHCFFNDRCAEILRLTHLKLQGLGVGVSSPSSRPLEAVIHSG
jgi:hypothetical protein